MFVGMSVRTWQVNGNLNPCTDLDKIFYAHPHLSKEDFGAVLTLAPPHPLGLGAPETLKAELIFLNPVLKNCWHGWPGIEPKTLNICSQSGAVDLSSTATLYLNNFQSLSLFKC